MRRADRGGQLYLRFRAVVYEDQLTGGPRPVHRRIVAQRDVYRRASDPWDWKAAVAEASDERRLLEAQMLEELLVEREEATRPPTFGELADAYAADAEDRGTRWDRERYRWNVLVAELGRERPMPEITPEWLDEWRRSLRARRKLSPRSVNAYVTLLRAICRLAVRTGRLQADPTAHLRPYPEHRGEVDWLSEDQMETVLAAARRLQEGWEAGGKRRAGARQVPVYDLVVTLYHTAARTGNVLGLTWGHVDWSAGVVVWQASEVKNRRRVVVPITGRLQDVLLDRFPGPGARGWIFPSPDDPKQHVSNQALRTAWWDVLAEAKLPRTKVYNLRHTRATHLLRETGDPVVVAELLGDTVKMVLERYAGRSPDRLRAALERVDGCPNAVPTLHPEMAANSGHEPAN